MTIDQPIEPVWGASPPTQQRWGLQETLVAMGVAAVIAGLGGAAIYAATGSPTQQAFGHGMPAGPPGGITAAQHLAGSPTTLHGEYVVAAGSGFATKLTQTGTVTAISPTVITVASADGFLQTYELNAAAHTDRTIDVSDQVSIQGRRDGGRTTATSVDVQKDPGGPVGPPGPAPHN
ncbi:hypothetical protein [Mycolicibacterium gadium]|uniref:DUF5666 domain-containing protein n=1 Tax=Mycolicibacterium gadium TaxID=1794 RepID=A0A7I7WUE1_MYCGU|nr:hypothetical protein [Mycolicibacterium gadium]BBZ21154.1 hypothetical protein MGAD_54890 [Mycolicibacterium gadium]